MLTAVPFVFTVAFCFLGAGVVVAFFTVVPVGTFLFVVVGKGVVVVFDRVFLGWIVLVGCQLVLMLVLRDAVVVHDLVVVATGRGELVFSTAFLGVVVGEVAVVVLLVVVLGAVGVDVVVFIVRLVILSR